VKLVDKNVADKPYTVLFVHLSTNSGFLVQYIYIKDLHDLVRWTRVVDRQHTVSTLSTGFRGK
jgi:hypothetical protein